MAEPSPESDLAVHRCAAFLVAAYPGVVGPALAAVAQEQIVTGNTESGALLLRLLCAVERLGALEPEPGVPIH